MVGPPTLNQQIQEILPEIRELRRAIHAYPEPGFEEEQTAARVVDHLQPLEGFEIQTGIAQTGVVATLEPDKAGPCIALRADMDCLPMEDTSGTPWQSTRPGLAHACGHDGHTAALVGAAKVLQRNRDRLAGPVKFIFQPAEESRGGGRYMVEAGVLSDPPVDAIFGLHGWPLLPVGSLGYRTGPMMAASDALEIVVKGQGSHAALPHQSKDPVMMAAAIIQALQPLVSRETDPLDSAVISITQMQGGSAFNVIPDEVTLKGTLRTLRSPVREYLHERIETVAQKVAELYGGRAEASVQWGYPVCVNSPIAVDYFKEIFSDNALHGIQIETVNPVMGGEDFAYFAEKVPANFAFLGTCPPGQNPPALLHQTHFDFNDEALPLAILTHVQTALEFKKFPHNDSPAPKPE